MDYQGVLEGLDEGQGTGSCTYSWRDGSVTCNMCHTVFVSRTLEQLQRNIIHHAHNKKHCPVTAPTQQQTVCHNF